MKRVKIGDVIEIETEKGFYYAQYTHKHPEFGALIRIFDKGFSNRPKFLKDVLKLKVRFSIFFPLQAAISQGIFSVVGNEVVLPELQKFPIFRDGIADPNTKTVKNWWLWDGKNEWQVGELKEEQFKLPIREIWNDTLLIKRLESGWTVEQDRI